MDDTDGSTTTLLVSFWDKLFPPHRDRKREMAASQRYVLPEPPYIESVSPGFKATWITSSTILCPAVAEHRVSYHFIVPYLYSCGIDTPNKVTLLNFFTVRLAVLFCSIYGGGDHGRGWYWALIILLSLQMLLDSADGQMARQYGLGSEFGAWLDIATDNIFGLCFMCIGIYKLALANDSYWPAIIFTLLLAKIGFLRNIFVAARNEKLHWHQMNILHRLGTYQMLYFSYYDILIVTTYLCLGWLH